VVFVLRHQDQTTDAAMAFLEVAADNDDTVFIITSTDAVFTEYKVAKDSVVLFKKVSIGLSLRPQTHNVHRFNAFTLLWHV